jgi:hypothetical protein
MSRQPSMISIVRASNRRAMPRSHRAGCTVQRTEVPDAAPPGGEIGADNPAVGFSSQRGARVGRPTAAHVVPVAKERHRVGQPEEGAKASRITRSASTRSPSASGRTSISRTLNPPGCRRRELDGTDIFVDGNVGICRVHGHAPRSAVCRFWWCRYPPANGTPRPAGQLSRRGLHRCRH